MSNRNIFKRMIVCGYNYHAIRESLRFLNAQHGGLAVIDSESGNGNGMTLLMKEVGDIIRQSKYSFVHLHAERLLTKGSRNSDFLNKINDHHYLLIDDINYLLSKPPERTAAIFDMLTSRQHPNKRTIFTCAIAAGELKNCKNFKKLSYLYSGTIIRLASPTFDDKAIIAKAIMFNLKLKHSEKIDDIIVKSHSIRELENKLIGYQAHLNYVKSSKID